MQIYKTLCKKTCKQTNKHKQTKHASIKQKIVFQPRASKVLVALKLTQSKLFLRSYQEDHKYLQTLKNTLTFSQGCIKTLTLPNTERHTYISEEHAE